MLYPYLNTNPQIDETNFVAPSADLIGRVSLGKHSSVWYNCTLRADINAIDIGESSNIQDNTVIHVADDYSVKIGSHVSVGHQCTIHACTVGNNVLVGIGSILMDGVEIGKNSIIGAGSLITKGKKFPEGTLILGSPARVLRKLTSEEVAYIQHLAKKYVTIKSNSMQVD